MTFNYKIGDVVYLKTDIDQRARIVTGIIIRQNYLVYKLSYNTDETDHYDIEISYEKDVLITIL